MAQTPTLTQAQLGTSAAAIVTAASGERLYISKVVVCNTAAGARTYSLWAVPPSQTAGNARALVLNRQLGASGSVTATEDVREVAGLVLDSGWSLQGAASVASSVTIHVQAVMIT
ncbi:hypothetical protein [Tepidiforma bonchosmolovskayae]|uniref:Head decoration protein n=1 Tax=Tepidiforma bonchosmolovskayae TaxID=2601677 RepID=A0ABX6C1L6_9CHLR|nr:hypothetical protein [Tepidiforma bonchosmolovskayae]QFG02170.1 hypothetical protein Tbon_02275 [Tepidiforma bonchosmolovskayae]